jgi:hypothetical protein
MLSEGLLMVLLVAASDMENGDTSAPEREPQPSLAPARAEPEQNPATAAPASPSRGYAIELRAGVGRLWGRFDRSGMIDDTRVEGTSIPLEFSAGLHLTDDWILFGEVSEVHAYTSANGAGRADLYGFGLGLKYYGTPTGFFLRGSVSRSFFRYRNDELDFITDWPGASRGISGRFAMGKEWRSWSRWHLGVAGELVVGRTQPEDYQSFTHVVGALVASVTYDSDDRQGGNLSTSPSPSDDGLAPLALYLDARLGLGRMWVSSGDLFISGATIPVGLAAGMSLTTNLVVFTEGSYISMTDPGTNDSYEQVRSFDLYGAGLGLKYYLTPRGLFLSGSVSVARLRCQGTASYYSDGTSGDTSHWGVWTRVAVGHEWPVSPYGSIGVAGELHIGRMGQGDHSSSPYFGADAYVPKALSLVLLTSFGSPAQYVAQPQPTPPTTGLFLSFAFAGGTVGGRIDSRNRVSSSTLDYLSKAFPLTMGLGYRFSPRWSSDVSGTYAPVTVRTSGATDSAYDARLGAALRWHWLSVERLHPWVSFGVGIEWFRSRNLGDIDVDANGYDWDLQIGSDVRMGRAWTLGPYASARVGRYRHLSLRPHWRGGSPSQEDVSLSDSAMHEWFTIGVRGTFASVQ